MKWRWNTASSRLTSSRSARVADGTTSLRLTYSARASRAPGAGGVSGPAVERASFILATTARYRRDGRRERLSSSEPCDHVSGVTDKYHRGASDGCDRVL